RTSERGAGDDRRESPNGRTGSVATRETGATREPRHRSARGLSGVLFSTALYIAEGLSAVSFSTTLNIAEGLSTIHGNGTVYNTTGVSPH
ncbi:MAG: hypothetical protein ABEI31_05705, partial [Halodesulfurarchaeum sp.]